MLLDDRRGSACQAKGIAEALGDRMIIEEKQLVYTRLASLPNWLRGKSLLGINTSQSSSFEAPYPDLILSTSRRTLPVARYLRKKSGNHSKIIQLMYPSGSNIKDLELIIIPEHDGEKKCTLPNAFAITGAPTRIFPQTLEEARRYWEPQFQNLPKPLIGVIIGGAIKGKPWPLDNAKDLAEELKKIHARLGGSFLLTSSRRTGKQAEDLIMEKLKDIPMYTYLWGEKKENPIMGFYACSDLIVATADSVSMCSEACDTGSPVLLFRGKNWLTNKHQNFAQSLIDGHYACDIKDKEALTFTPDHTINATSQIAEKLLMID